MKDSLGNLPFGFSVTQVANHFPQPPGDLLPPSMFEKTFWADTKELAPKENIHPSIVGTTVDYLSRLITGAPKEEAFAIALRGAEIAGKKERALALLEGIHGLDEESVEKAARLARYDSVVRVGLPAWLSSSADGGPDPDEATTRNIQAMVRRTQRMLDMEGGKTLDHLTFEGGYTSLVATGDGDFMTKDGLWDLKTTKSPINAKHTLQLLMYWRMGLHSVHPEYKDVRKLGFMNPRRNLVETLEVRLIPEHVIQFVEKEVIGY